MTHRDLKPANIMLTRAPGGTPLVRLVDFGIARLARTEGHDPSWTDSLPRCLGTPAYMSPEQIQARPVDRRAELYALGGILFEMLTGRRVFQTPTPTEHRRTVVGRFDVPRVPTLPINFQPHSAS